MKYELLTGLRRNGKRTPAGEHIELNDKEAAPLLDRDRPVIRPVNAKPPAAGKSQGKSKSAGEKKEDANSKKDDGAGT